MSIQEKFPRLSLDATYLAMRQRTRLWLMASDEYYAIAKSEYERIACCFTAEPRSILDIGPGLGGYHIYMQKAYSNLINFHFLDRDKVDNEMKFGFRDKTEAYNSFELTMEVLTGAGLTKEQLHFWDAENETAVRDLLATNVLVDAVVSLYSWGFHYPVSTYLDLVLKVLKPGGILILDLRCVREQEDALFAEFEIVREIDLGRENNSRRLCLRMRTDKPTTRT